MRLSKFMPTNKQQTQPLKSVVQVSGLAGIIQLAPDLASHTRTRAARKRRPREERCLLGEQAAGSACLVRTLFETEF